MDIHRIDYTNQRDTPQRAGDEPAAGLQLETLGTPGRQALEAAVARRFEAVFGAHISEFMPYLLSLSVDRRTCAVAGLRPAAGGSLFLERYLDRAIEHELSDAFRLPVDRAQVVEIGNLAALSSGAGYLVFALLAALLSDAGYRWVVCTATPQVEGMLRKMGLAPHRLCAADPQRLGADAVRWGQYYATLPNIIAGDVREAAGRIAGALDGTAAVASYRKVVVDLLRARQG